MSSQHPRFADMPTEEFLAVCDGVTQLAMSTAKGASEEVLTHQVALLRSTTMTTPDHIRAGAWCLAMAQAEATLKAYDITTGGRCTCGDPTCKGLAGGDARIVFGRRDEGSVAIVEPEEIPEPMRTAGRLIVAAVNRDADTAVDLVFAVPAERLNELMAVLHQEASMALFELDQALAATKGQA